MKTVALIIVLLGLSATAQSKTGYGTAYSGPYQVRRTFVVVHHLLFILVLPSYSERAMFIQFESSLTAMARLRVKMGMVKGSIVLGRKKYNETDFLSSYHSRWTKRGKICASSDLIAWMTDGKSIMQP